MEVGTPGARVTGMKAWLGWGEGRAPISWEGTPTCTMGLCRFF